MIKPNATVILRKQSTTSYDDLGLPVITAGTETEHRVLVEWGTSLFSEDLDERVSSVDGAVHFVNGFRDVDEDDVLIINGKEYVIAGEVKAWAAPDNFSIRVPLTVEFKRVES